mmetsp:Transcript_13761/g.21413  ORF Transcript_13761/g.21413 Transcript_13761/m.21413 type:complete len:437 (-) Transcript_13761:71-1381(-)
MNTTAPRQASTERRSSLEGSMTSSVSSRLGDEELDAVASLSTRRLLKNMDDDQLEKAMKGLKVVRLKRQASIKSIGDSRRMLKQSSDISDGHNEETEGGRSSKTEGSNDSDTVAGSADDDDDDAGDAGQLDEIPPLPSFGKEKGSSAQFKKFPPNDERRMSKSLDGFAGIGDHDYSQYLSDSDSDEDGSTQDDRKVASAHRPEYFKPMSRGLTKLHEHDEEDKKSDVDCDAEEAAKEQLNLTPSRRARTQRRTPLLSNSMGPVTSHARWKPLSRPSVDEHENENDQEKKKEETEADTGAGGIGGLWNNFKKTLSGGSGPVEETPKEPTKVDGGKYFRRGKRRAEKCQFLEAVALFNFALVRQREELGKNHIDCARTLNEIGSCWMMLGERYPAMTAYEEALYILQKHLGDGAEEVAEVTNNIWMVLHEQREESLME